MTAPDFDPAVLAALARWPAVPAVAGWLSLTARGQWRLRGEPIGNAAIAAFIGRNYAADAQGRWFFQNGPQRVYVALELTPWVYRFQPDGVVTHTGHRPQALRAALLLDDGRMLIDTDLGAGVIDDRDTAALTTALMDAAGAPIDDEALSGWLAGAGDAWLDAARLALAGGRVPVARSAVAALEARFGFVRRPVVD